MDEFAVFLFLERDFGRSEIARGQRFDLTLGDLGWIVTIDEVFLGRRR